MKVGNSPKVEETHQGSWRQAILNSVVTPSKGMDGTDGQSEYLSPMRITRESGEAEGQKSFGNIKFL